MSKDGHRVLKKTLAYGITSITLYVLLYIFEQDILTLSKEGKWNFYVPMLIAFIFSIIHGNFTGQFWDLFGVKPKTTKK